jgi:phosphoglycerate dehydrogenase-like enzyme
MTGSDPIEVLMTVSIPDEAVASLRQISPRLRITMNPTRRAEDIPAEVWGRTEILYTDRVLPAVSLVPNLRWIQFHTAGVDFSLDAPVVKQQGMLVTTLSGAAAAQVAEHAMMMMLALGHKMADIFTSQSRGEWPKDRWERFMPLELRGSTVGLVGYGSIGREIARLLQPFGAKILAAKRDVMHPTDEGFSLPGLGDPEGDLFSRLYPFQALRPMLKECDFVVISLPITAETRGLVGKPELEAMKASAYLIDVGRGGVVDPEALLEVLQTRKIAGAALDVFSDEPLSSSSPFWRLTNVIVTPHIAGISSRYAERAMVLFHENLERYLEDSPLLNRFEGVRGY